MPGSNGNGRWQVDDSEPRPDHNGHTPRRRSVPPAAARALSPRDLAVLGVLITRDPATWTTGEAVTVRQIRGRAGGNAHMWLDELLGEARPALDPPHLKPLREERDRVEAQRAQLQARHPEVVARHRARDIVGRRLAEIEGKWQQSIRDKYEPLLRSAYNADHRAGIETAMRAELQQVGSQESEMRRRRPELEAEEAAKIQAELEKENVELDRALAHRHHALNREIRQAGLDVPLAHDELDARGRTLHDRLQDLADAEERRRRDDEARQQLKDEFGMDDDNQPAPEIDSSRQPA